MSILEKVEAAIGQIAEQRGPSVVAIARRSGRGSGIVVGVNEVLTLAGNLRTREPQIEFADGRSAAGKVIGVDGELDLALVGVDTADVKPVDWGEQKAIGAAVVGLANPGGQGLRATFGFVASADRRFRGPRGRLVTGALEHTAPLPRGAAGGPLVDLGGAVVGLNAVRVHGGLILALPAAAIQQRIAALRSGEPVEPRQLGVAIVPPRVAKRLRRATGLPERDGLLVRAVADDSPAARSGVQQGDLIVSADGQDVDGVDALYRALDAAESLKLGIVRATEELELTVELGGKR
jgi:serine protease Do